MKYEMSTYNTKRNFAEALKTLMRQKPLSKITVSELVKTCGVNRKTFYYHFEDIYALLEWMFEKEVIEVVKNFDLMVDYEEAITFVIDYVEQNDYIIHCAYDSIGRDEMKRFFFNDFQSIVLSIIDGAEAQHHTSLEPGYKQFLCDFYTEALAGCLIDWITYSNLHKNPAPDASGKKKEPLSRSQVIEYLKITLHDSLTGIMTHKPD